MFAAYQLCKSIKSTMGLVVNESSAYQNSNILTVFFMTEVTKEDFSD